MMEAVIDNLKKRRKINRRKNTDSASLLAQAITETIKGLSESSRVELRIAGTSQDAVMNQDAMIDTARARTRALALEQAAATKALFAQWQAEDATDDPEELKRRDAEMLELQHAMNENRKATGERIPFPELETRA